MMSRFLAKATLPANAAVTWRTPNGASRAVSSLKAQLLYAGEVLILAQDNPAHAPWMLDYRL